MNLVIEGTPNTVLINKTNFSSIFKVAFEQTMLMAAIKSGFKNTGIYQFNPDSLLQPVSNNIKLSETLVPIEVHSTQYSTMDPPSTPVLAVLIEESDPEDSFS